MPAPRTPYEAVLRAARDVTKVDSAFDAELLGSALLGSVYAVAEGDRMGAVREFVRGFMTFAKSENTAAARAIRLVFGALVPDAPAAPPAFPAWADKLGRVRLTGSYAYGDAHGDQTSYVATFAYDDTVAGGPEHAIVALIDHNIGIAKDIFVGSPAEIIVGQIRELCDTDELTWFTEVPPERLRVEVARHLAITDSLESLPDDDSFATDRTLVEARLGSLPEASIAEPAPLDAEARKTLVAEFLAGPEASDAGLDKADEQSLMFALSLVFDHAETFPDVDPLRWSPIMVQLFLLDWVHRRAVLDDSDAEVLPRALRAWVAYAARLRGVPAAARDDTLAAVDALAPEFARLHASGERRSPATQAVAQLIAEGVDPNDSDAVTAWLRANGPGHSS
jgi:hypothetical protein